jgi:hypothetical protein
MIVGTCIDCYASTAHPRVLRNMAKANVQTRNFLETKIEKKNVQTYDFIDHAKSSYSRKDQAEFYRRNRIM